MFQVAAYRYHMTFCNVAAQTRGVLKELRLPWPTGDRRELALRTEPCNWIDNGFAHVDLVVTPVRRPEQAAQLPAVPERVPENFAWNLVSY
jgi:hypothetical protein